MIQSNLRPGGALDFDKQVPCSEPDFDARLRSIANPKNCAGIHFAATGGQAEERTVSGLEQRPDRVAAKTDAPKRS